jgi:hypothetical protein
MISVPVIISIRINGMNPQGIPIIIGTEPKIPMQSIGVLNYIMPIRFAIGISSTNKFQYTLPPYAGQSVSEI